MRAPAERVWQLLADVEGSPAWTESMREIKRLEDGPFVVGSRSRVTQPTGRPMVWTAIELELMRNFTWAARQPGLSFEAVHRIDDAEAGVRTTLEFIRTGPLAWLASLIAGFRIRSSVDMESAGLERAAETG